MFEFEFMSANFLITSLISLEILGVGSRRSKIK